MLPYAAFGKQDPGDDGTSMPDKERGSGLGDRSHGGEVAEVWQIRLRRGELQTNRNRAECCQISQEHEPMNRKRRKKAGTEQQDWSLNLEIVHPNAAGIDIGNEFHYVAVPPGRDPSAVRHFACFTEDLHRLTDWLKSLGIDTVAMQSTGVYWLPVFEILTEKGLEPAGAQDRRAGTNRCLQAMQKTHGVRNHIEVSFPLLQICLEFLTRVRREVKERHRREWQKAVPFRDNLVARPREMPWKRAVFATECNYHLA